MSNFGIDARWMVGNYRGMGRYARQLISPIFNKVIALTPNNVIHHELKTISYGLGFFPWWEQFVLPKVVGDEKIKFLICPYNTAPIIKPKNTKLILVVHDLIFMRSWSELPPSVSLYQTLGRIYRRWVVPRSIKNADVILTVSEYTKIELETYLTLSIPVNVIPNAIEDSWLQQPYFPLELRDNYLFTVAGEAPSKNLKRLIQAFANVLDMGDDNGIILKVAGVNPSHHEKFVKLAHKLGVNERIEFLGFVSNEELKKLYSQAKGFIFPSLFEGFGIPLLEAMACHTPIACSNTTSLPEVVGEHAYLFNPSEVSDISAGIISLINPNAEMINQVQKAYERVLGYSASTIEQKFKSFWESIDVN